MKNFSDRLFDIYERSERGQMWKTALIDHDRIAYFAFQRLHNKCDTDGDEMIKLKRVYEKADDSDGFRVLVDRLWPRGVSKEEAKLNEWLRDIAPSDELRKWFGHDPDKWDEFKRRYREELASKEELVNKLIEDAKGEDITLLYASRETKYNNVVVLKNVLEERV
jgi:uncharacterized protein YeaO (DUF488 family)